MEEAKLATNNNGTTEWNLGRAKTKHQQHEWTKASDTASS